MRLLLEVIVQSAADAVAAEAGGADRLEVVRDIRCGGLTPPLDVVQAIAAATGLPLRVMVRERATFTVQSSAELAALQRAFEGLAELRVDGAVLGFARDGAVDLGTTSAVLQAAPALRATFHRAFDEVPDPSDAIASLRSAPQIDRILTTGGSGSWQVRCARLEHLASAAGSRLIVLAGGGMDEEGLRMLRQRGVIREGHVGRAACDPPVPGAPVSAERVKRLRDAAG